MRGFALLRTNEFTYDNFQTQERATASAVALYK